MAEKTREDRIKAEERRLNRIFRVVKDDNKIRTAQGLIPRAAFLRITLEECETDITELGVTEKFSQSENQTPYDRKRPVADLYSAYNTSYQKIIKQLTDLLPVEAKKEIDPFIEYIGGEAK